MDNPESVAPVVLPSSPPPSYVEANPFPFPTSDPEEIPSTPPPVYSPGVYPPSYTEAVNVPSQNGSHPDPYPVLHVGAARQSRQAANGSPPHVVVVGQEVLSTLGEGPTATVCQYCHHRVTTNVDYKAGGATWGMCCLLTLLGLICGFCLIPFWVKGFQDVHHSCPNCHRHLGIYVRK